MTTVRTFGPEVRVNTTTANDQTNAYATALIDGGYVVTWVSSGQDGSGSGIYAQRYDASGVAVGGEVAINTTVVNDQNNPTVCALSDGGYVIAWSSNGQDGSDFGVYAQRYNSQGAAVGGEVLVNTTTLHSQEYSTITGLSDGGYVVTWRSRDQAAPGLDIYAQRYDSSGSAVGGEVRVNTTTALDQVDPSVTGLVGGGYVVTWMSYAQDGSSWGVYLQHYNSVGGPVGGEVLVNTLTPSHQSYPTIAALSDGGYVVTWISYLQDGSGYGVYAQRYDASGSAIGVETHVTTATNNDQIYPSVAGLTDGGFVVTWMSNLQDGSGYGVYAQEFNVTGIPVGGEVRVNVATTNDQTYPSISVLSDGRYVVSWQSSGQDGSGFGIYSRTISPSSILVEMTAAQELVDGTVGDDIIQVGAGGLNAGDVVDGRGGSDTLLLTTPGTVDMSDVTLIGVEAIAGSSGTDVLTNDNATWDLTGISLIEIESLMPTAAAAIVRVSDVATALLIDGSASNVTVQATGLTLTAEQRAEMFASGVETIVEAGNVTTWADGVRFIAGDEFRVNTTTSSDQHYPAIATLADGGYVVTWRSNGQDGSGYGVYAQRYDASGVAVGGEVRINTTITSDQMDPSVTGLVDGGYVVTWMSLNQDLSSYGIYGQRYDSAGAAVGTEVRINTTTALEQMYPSIAALPNGGYVVAWMSNSTNGYWGLEIFAQQYDDQGKTVGSERLVNTTSPASQALPSIASLVDGGYIVTWISWGQDGSEYGVYAQRFDSTGVVVGGEFRVNSTTVNFQYAPSITGLSDGGYVVTWMSNLQDGSGYGVYAQRYDASGAAVGGEAHVSTATANDQRYSSVTALTDGGYVIVWQSNGQDGSAEGVYAQRYDAAGNAVGGEELINTTTANSQASPVVTALANGGYVVTWESSGQDGSGMGVYARQFTGLDYHVLTPGADNVIGTNGDTLVVGAASEINADALVGNGGTDTLELSASGTLDLRLPATFSGFEVILGASGADTVLIKAARLAGITTIDTRGGYDTLVLAGGGTFDLSGMTLTSVDEIRIEGNTGELITVKATAGADRVVGGLGNDSIRGEAGDDMLIGGAGNDELYGDDGTDSARYSGNRADYTITYNRQASTFTIVDKRPGSPDGTDTVSGVETFVFNGVTYQDSDFTNDPPTGAPTATLADGTEDTTYIVSVASLTQGFTDANGDTLTIAGLTASNGTVTDNGNGTFTITPTSNFNGIVTLTYTVSDGYGGTVPGQTRTYTVNPVDDAPTDLILTSARLSGGVLTILEHAAGAIGTLSATDVDSANLTFSTNDPRFEIIGNELRIASDVAFDFERDSNPGTVTITVSDGVNTSTLTLTLAIADASTDIVTVATSGADTIIGGAAADQLFGADGDDDIRGGAGGDLLSGGIGNDSIIGEAGDDTLIGAAGADTLNGGADVDTITYASSSSGIVINLATGLGYGGDALGDQLSDIEILIGSSQNDVVYGGTGVSVDGGDGYDYLIETEANQTVHLGTAQANSIEILILGGGTNVADVTGSQFEYIYGGGAGSTNTVTLGSGGGYLIANGGTNHMFGGGATSVFIGGVGASDMHGGTGNNVYYVGANDSVAGAGTYNTVVALASGLTLNLGTSNVQQVILNGGTNTLDMTGSTEFVTLYGGGAGSTNTMTTGAGGGYLISSGGTNHMFGGEGPNVFVGGVGESDMHGGAGLAVNTYYVGAGDTVAGAGAYNTLVELATSVSLVLGSAGLTNVQQFILNTGNNTVDASSAASQIIIYGQSGDDRIGGGLGNDYLSGAGGSNTFVVHDHWGADTITDWGAGTGNKIDMTALASVGVHSMADLTVSVAGGNDVITHGTDTITLTGFAGALTAANFIFA